MCRADRLNNIVHVVYTVETLYSIVYLSILYIYIKRAVAAPVILRHNKATEAERQQQQAHW
jgi:hypothetical protein